MEPIKRIFHPKGKSMTTLAFTDDPREMAKRLEAFVGGRKTLARQLGCAPGTLENFQRDRLKEVKANWLQRKLEAFLVRKIEAEITRLTNELDAYRQAGGDISQSPKLVRLVSAVEAARKLIDSMEAGA